MDQIKRKFLLAKIITVIMAVGMGALVLFNLKSCQQRDEIIEAKTAKEESIAREVEKEASIIKRQVDRYGIERVTVSATKELFPNAKLNSALREGLMDTTARALNIQKSQITSFIQITATMRAEKLILKREIDSLKRLRFVFKDKYITATVTPRDSTPDSKDLLDFEYRAELNSYQYFKQLIPFIGTKRSYTDFYSPDTRLTINGVKRYTLENVAPKSGLRLQVRAIYGLRTKKFYAGPGLSIDMGRFNVLGQSYYNYTDKHWQSTIGLNYDLATLF